MNDGQWDVEEVMSALSCNSTKQIQISNNNKGKNCVEKKNNKTTHKRWMNSFKPDLLCHTPFQIKIILSGRLSLAGILAYGKQSSLIYI